MADPISITAGILSILKGSVTIIQSLNTLKEKFDFSHLTIASLSAECSTTSMGLSQLQSALQADPNLLVTLSHSQEELTTCFEMAIWSIATVFSLLDDEVTKLNKKSSAETKIPFRNKVRSLWIEDLLKERAQQIRDQRSSLEFLLDCVKLNRSGENKRLQRNISSASTTLRRNYTNARSLRRESNSTTIRDYGVKNLGINLERRTLEISPGQLSDSPKINPPSLQNRPQYMYNLPDEVLSSPLKRKPLIETVPHQNRKTDKASTGYFHIPAGQPEVTSPTNVEIAGKESHPRLPLVSKQLISNDHPHKEQIIELHVAISKEFTRKAEALIHGGCDINVHIKLANDPEEYSPLERALLMLPSKHAMNILHLLLKGGAAVDEVLSQPLRWGSVDLVGMLAHNSNNTTPEEVITTALAIACHAKGLDLTEHLRRGDGPSTLELAFYESKTPILKGSLQISKGKFLRPLQCQELWTPLHIAAIAGFSDLAIFLIQKGTLVDARTSDNWTPLHCAARRGHIGIAEMLISKGAEVNAKASGHWTPLHFATRQGHISVAELLIQKGAEVDARSLDDLTPIHLAAFSGHIHVFKLLIDSGASYSAKTIKSETLLLIAARQGFVEIIKMLLQIRIQVELDERDSEGRTALGIAALRGHQPVCKVLICSGASIDCKNHDGETPLMSAARNNLVSIIKFLIVCGADIQAKDLDGHSALHYAARRGHTDSIHALLDAGILVDVMTREGHTSLYYAAKKGHYDAAKLLLWKGADRALTAENKCTPQLIAKKNGHEDIATLIED